MVGYLAEHQSTSLLHFLLGIGALFELYELLMTLPFVLCFFFHFVRSFLVISPS